MNAQILVPTDGGEHAERAFDHALQMAETTGRDLHLMHVVDTDRYGEPALSTSELVITQQEDEGTQLLQRLAVRAREREVSTTLQRSHGDPVETILDRIDHENVDTVVMPRQGFDHERSRRDVSTQLLRRSDAEIVLV